MKPLSLHLLAVSSVVSMVASAPAAASGIAVAPETPAQLFQLSSVRLLDQGPFAPAVKANRAYVLAHDPARLLAPFRREAGLPSEAQPYGNWESSGLDGHTLGHYLSALAHMIAAGEDTPDGELRRRLNAVIDGLSVCQQASSDGYIGGVPEGRKLWAAVAAGEERAIFRRWAPWYNLHKTFAGLRDAYLEAGNARARDILVRYGDWCVGFTSRLTDEQMQQMLGNEHGGMNEVMADLYAITGDRRYLETAERFNHKAILDPLIQHQDQLTGKHANTQIPKVIGLERIATLTGNRAADSGARFFWETVTRNRSVAFGGNSVSEHFNDPHDFHGLLAHREGPGDLQHLQHAAAHRAVVRQRTGRHVRRLLRARALQPHPGLDRLREPGVRLLHPDSTGPLPGLLGAGPRASGAASAPAWRIPVATASSSMRGLEMESTSTSSSPPS